MECTIDWGCTTASMRSGVMPNSQRASIISNALLSIVAESMVILAPIDQLGWARASRTVTLLSSSMLRVRKGPPEAVISSFFTVDDSSPAIHWYMAECSESTGIIREGELSSRRVTSSPATTIVSLLARAICLPASMARRVGARPL